MASLIVEDGSGLSNSNGYASVAEVDSYVDDHSQDATWISGTTADKEKAIRLATQYLDNYYGTQWRGRRVVDTQALDWPRYDVIDDDGYVVLADEVPRQIKDACAELAVRSISGTTLEPDLTEPGSIEMTRVRVDVIEEEIRYSGSRSNYVRFDVVDRLLASLIESGATMERS